MTARRRWRDRAIVEAMVLGRAAPLRRCWACASNWIPRLSWTVSPQTSLKFVADLVQAAITDRGVTCRTTRRAVTSGRDHLKVPHDHDNTLELGRMVDDGRLEDVLALVSLQEIAEAWSCFHDRQRSNGWAAATDPDWWAVDFWLTSSHSSGPESAIREGLLALVDIVPEDLLDYVGAGPLMNFVGPDEDRIAWIEGVAAKSFRFRAALTAVATWHEEGWVVERLERAAGASLYRPPPTDT